MRKLRQYFMAAAALILLASCGKGTDESTVSVEDLKSDNLLLRLKAIDEVARTREESAVPELVKLLAPHNFEEVRLKSVTALGAIGSQEALPALIDLLDDPSIEIRSAVVTALGKLKNARATDPLMLVDGELELAVIWALGNIGDRKAVPYLNDRMTSDDPYVRYNASRALARLQ